MSVTDIVFECGFEQPSHFSRAFKAKYGHTPSEYRDALVARRRTQQADRSANTLVRWGKREQRASGISYAP